MARASAPPPLPTALFILLQAWPAMIIKSAGPTPSALPAFQTHQLPLLFPPHLNSLIVLQLRYENVPLAGLQIVQLRHSVCHGKCVHAHAAVRPPRAHVPVHLIESHALCDRYIIDIEGTVHDTVIIPAKF
jgi:hypothetical protein